MMDITFSLLISILLATQRIQGSNTYDSSIRLSTTLSKDYNKGVRPVFDDSKNVTITVGVSLYLIKHLDDKYQSFTTSLWIRQKWHDPRLTWDPADFENITSINLRAKHLWLPDIKVYNEIERSANSGLDQFHTRLIVDYLGNILWMGPCILKSSCPVDIEMFPYDTQTCQFKIGSWTYDGLSVDVIPESYTMDISKSPSNPGWKLLSTSVKRNIVTYPCCPESYPDITYTLKIKRRVQSYWINFLYPGIFLTIITMLGFVTPPSDTGERISLVLTSLVSMFFFLKMISNKTPESETIPLLSTYFVMLSFEIALIFYSVCLSVNAYHNRGSKDMPKSIRGLVLQKLGGLWGLTKRREAIAHRIQQLEKLRSRSGHSEHDSVSDSGEFCEVVPNESIRFPDQSHTVSNYGDFDSPCAKTQGPPNHHYGNEFIWLSNGSRQCSAHAGARRRVTNGVNTQHHFSESTPNKNSRESCPRNVSPRSGDYGSEDTKNIKPPPGEVTRNANPRDKDASAIDPRSESPTGLNISSGSLHNGSHRIHDSRILYNSYINPSEEDFRTKGTTGEEAIRKKVSWPKDTRHKTTIAENGDPVFCSCSVLLHQMVAANDRLIFNLGNICLVARRFEKEASEKERWFLASSILDQVFLVFFVLCFITLSVVTFLLSGEK